MSTGFKPQQVLLVYLRDTKGRVGDENYQRLFLNDLTKGRETILSNIFEASKTLMEDHEFDFMDIIFLDPDLSYPKDHLKRFCEALVQSNFTTLQGYQKPSRIGLFYDADVLHPAIEADAIAPGHVDIPDVGYSAIRHLSGVTTCFQTYDKWNEGKYLDLELAFFANEQGTAFKLVPGAANRTVQSIKSSPDKNIHKAAIYNELFVKNTFGAPTVHHSVFDSNSQDKEVFGRGLNIIKAFDDEIGKAARKAKYVTSKVGNFDVLEYDIQADGRPKSVFKNISSVLGSKRDEFVTFSLASIPERAAFLKRTIQSIYKQSDQIHVYLNGYRDVPDFLIDSKIKVYRSQESGDLSANGKIWFLRESPKRGYVFLIDDDIIYPKNYVKTMVETLKKYQHRFAACVHGSIFSDQLQWYYQRSSMFPFKRGLAHDCLVNLPGSGTFVFNTDTLELDYDDFQPFTMVDLILGILCRNQKVPIISVARNRDWLEVQKDLSGKDLWSSFKAVITLHTPTALANGPWDFKTVKSYALPQMEAMFDVRDANFVEEMRLDKQFLHSAYRETTPQLWSFAGRLQRVTEQNYQKFLNAAFNDQIDKYFDADIYDSATQDALAFYEPLQALNRQITHFLELESAPDAPSDKIFEALQAMITTPDNGSHGDYEAGSAPLGKANSLLQ